MIIDTSRLFRNPSAQPTHSSFRDILMNPMSIAALFMWRKKQRLDLRDFYSEVTERLVLWAILFRGNRLTHSLSPLFHALSCRGKIVRDLGSSTPHYLHVFRFLKYKLSKFNSFAYLRKPLESCFLCYQRDGKYNFFLLISELLQYLTQTYLPCRSLVFTILSFDMYSSLKQIMQEIKPEIVSVPKYSVRSIISPLGEGIFEVCITTKANETLIITICVMTNGNSSAFLLDFNFTRHQQQAPTYEYLCNYLLVPTLLGTHIFAVSLAR